VKADAEKNFSKRKAQPSASKEVKCRSPASVFSPRINKQAKEEFFKKNLSPNFNDELV
jgi:hypothetical protein